MRLSSKIFIIIILILIFVIFLQRCNNVKYVPQKPDTTYIHDTTKITLKGDTKYIPTPYKVEVPKDSLVYIIDTPKNLIDFRNAYFKLLKEKIEKKYYSDSLKIEDNGLIGYIYSNDTLQKNSIIGKRIGYKLTYPKIKETQIITKEQHKKTLYFVGVDLLVNKQLDKLSGEINIGFLNKKTKYYEIGIQSWNNEAIYKLGTKIKL